MLRKELSLIINSLLVQSAAGIFISMAILRKVPAAGYITDKAETGMMIAGPIIMLSMITSLFHLGNPLRAYRALTNISSSWLSREILFTGVFFALWCVFMFLEINGIQNSYIIILTAITGIVSVVSMAGIYYSTGKSGWHSINTYTDFIGSIVVFGCICFSAVMAAYGKGFPSAAGFVSKAGIMLIVVTGLKLFQALVLIPSLNKNSEDWNMDKFVAGEESIAEWIKMFKILTFIGIAVSFSGGIIILTGSVLAELYSIEVYIYLSVFLVIAGESISRTGFYCLGVEYEGKEIKDGFKHDVYGRFVTDK